MNAVHFFSAAPPGAPGTFVVGVFAPRSSHLRILKTRLGRVLLLVAAALPSWGADALTTAFQQGLLEEEVNRNPTNAIVAYERVVQGLDEQRPLAATALFRLGECYRKLGQTNEAVAAYQRILRDFTEEATLSKLSRENLVALGFGSPVQAKTNAAPAALAARSDSAEEADRLSAQIAGIERLKDDPEKQAQAVLAFFPDDGLKRMLLNLPALEQQAALYQANPDTKTNTFRFAVTAEGRADLLDLRLPAPQMTAAQAQSEVQEQLAAITDRVRFILDTQNARLLVLRSSTGAAPAAEPASAFDPAEVELVRGEIKLVEEELNDAEQRTADRQSTGQINQLKRDLLTLQRKLPENSAPARQQELIRQSIALAQTNLEALSILITAGRAPKADETRARRELLQLQYALAMAQRNQGGGAATPTEARLNPSPMDPAELASIQEEIKLVEQERLSVQKRFETGRASQADLRKVQRDLLQLQRKLPENASPPRQLALLGQERQLLQENLAEIQKQIQVGAAAPDDEIPVRRELLALQRELAAARRAPVVATTEVGGGPAPATNEEADEIKRIQAIIRDSPDLVNAHNATGGGGTPLHAAADKGYVTVTEYLLANQADVNARDNTGRTPLHIAAQNGHKKLCEMLLAAGANVNAADNSAYTPLHFAALNGYQSVAEALLAKGAQVNTQGYVPPVGSQPAPNSSNWAEMETTPLHSAAEKGFPATVELLLQHGAEINARDRGGRTPLMRTILRNQPATAKLLLEKGADVNAEDGEEQTALADAVIRRNTPLVQLLLDHKADLELRVGSGNSEFGWTVLFEPVGKGEVEMTRLLLDRGANLNAKATTGITPVHWAVLQNAQATLKLLLERKAEVNVRDSGGNTPLHYALVNANAVVVEALLAAGADPNAPGWTNGETQPWWPLFRAVTSPTEVGGQITAALLKHGADANAKTTNGWTALHRAVQYNRADLAELLVADKADINAHGSQPKDEPSLGERKAEGARTAIAGSTPPGGLSMSGPGRMPPRLQPGGISFTTASYPGGTPQFPADKDVTPLHLAVANQNLELAKFLLDHGADVNARDADGRTALHFAVNRRDLDLIRLLLDAKADPDAKDSAGETPLALAIKLSSLGSRLGVNAPNRGSVLIAEPSDIIALLRERGAKEPPDPSSTLSVEIDRAGQYWVSGKLTTLDELAQRLSAPDRNLQRAQITLRAEEGVQPKGVQNLVDLLNTNALSVTISRQIVPKTIFDADPERTKAGGSVSLFGAVRVNVFGLRSGETTSLSKALLEVGLTENAALSRVRLTRMNPDTKQPETKTVNLLGLKRGEPVEEILLQDGDRVDVPTLSP